MFSLFRSPKKFCSILLLALVPVTAVFSTGRYMLVRVREDSMMPTLKDGQLVVVRRGKTGIRPGDIAVFVSPYDSQLVIKRCVLSAEAQLIIEHGWLITPFGRWYLSGPQWDSISRRTSPQPESLFMVGDNQFWSYDSRDYGFVPRQNLVGRVVTRKAHD